MKKSEWDRRLPLDRKGVRILGAALLQRACNHIDLARRIECHTDNSEAATVERNKFSVRNDVGRSTEELAHWAEKCTHLECRLKALGVTEEENNRAQTLRAKDFRFRWDNLMQHRVLLAFITDDLPDWAKSTDQNTPISQRENDALTNALEHLFVSEFDRLEGPDPDFLPYLQKDDEFLFHLAVWKHCEVELGRGHPKGNRWQDGLDNAASHAWSLRHDAEEEGNPISTEEAIRRSVNSFNVMGSKEFEDTEDKASALVSDSATGRLEGAIKRVRKRLKEIDAQEKLFN